MFTIDYIDNYYLAITTILTPIKPLFNVISYNNQYIINTNEFNLDNNL
jgi:hypothetical protein